MPLLTPTLYIKKLTDINVEILKGLDIESVLLDVDDTIAVHGCPIPVKGALKWTNTIRESNIKIIIVSNNFRKRVEPLAQRLGLPFVSLSLKPFPAGMLRAINKISSHINKSVVIGDQIFTDILGANLCGIKSILIDPLSQKGDMTLNFKRRLEKPIRRKIKDKFNT